MTKELLMKALKFDIFLISFFIISNIIKIINSYNKSTFIMIVMFIFTCSFINMFLNYKQIYLFRRKRKVLQFFKFNESSVFINNLLKPNNPFLNKKKHIDRKVSIILNKKNNTYFYPYFLPLFYFVIIFIILINSLFILPDYVLKILDLYTTLKKFNSNLFTFFYFIIFYFFCNWHLNFLFHYLRKSKLPTLNLFSTKNYLNYKNKSNYSIRLNYLTFPEFPDINSVKNKIFIICVVIMVFLMINAVMVFFMIRFFDNLFNSFIRALISAGGG